MRKRCLRECFGCRRRGLSDVKNIGEGRTEEMWLGQLIETDPLRFRGGKVTQSYESAYLYLLMIYRRSLVHFEKFHCGERGLVQDVACVMATCECLWVNHDQWEPTHCMPLWRLNEVVFQNRRKPWMIKVCLFPPRQVGKSMTQGSFFFSAHLCDNSILVS